MVVEVSVAVTTVRQAEVAASTVGAEEWPTTSLRWRSACSTTLAMGALMGAHTIRVVVGAPHTTGGATECVNPQLSQPHYHSFVTQRMTI